MTGEGNGNGSKLKNHPNGERRQATRKIPIQKVNIDLSDPSKMRKSPRKKILTETRASIFVDQPSQGVIKDISLGGIKIASVVQLAINSKVGIFFQMPGCKGITLICQVIWQQEYGDGNAHLAGLQIIETSNEATFQDFVEQLPDISVQARN